MFKQVSDTPVITAGAYSALDAVGGKLEFTDVCSSYENSGEIRKAFISDKGKQEALLYLVLFSKDFTATADNDAFAVSDADLLNIIAVIEFAIADYAVFDANDFVGEDINVPFVLVEGGSSLFGQLFVKTSTPTYTATDDLEVSLVIK